VPPAVDAKLHPLLTTATQGVRGIAGQLMSDPTRGMLEDRLP
jgi:hypothetical protein